MDRQERDELARQLSVSAPAPEQPPSFFESLGRLAAASTPTTVRARRPRLLRAVAIATGTTVLVSSAAYAGALGEHAQTGVRHVLGHGQKAHHQGHSDPAPLEKVAPVIVLEPRSAQQDQSSPTSAPSREVETVPTVQQPELDQSTSTGPDASQPAVVPDTRDDSAVTDDSDDPGSTDDSDNPGSTDGPSPRPADDQGDDDTGTDGQDDGAGQDEDGATPPSRTSNDRDDQDDAADDQGDPADAQDAQDDVSQDRVTGDSDD